MILSTAVGQESFAQSKYLLHSRIRLLDLLLHNDLVAMLLMGTDAACSAQASGSSAILLAQTPHMAVLNVDCWLTSI